MTPEEILEIADKNGFDWFTDKESFKGTFNKMSAEIKELGNSIITKNGLEIYYRNTFLSEVSLADLATNKSFLEALLKACGKEVVPTVIQTLTGEELDLTYERIQLRLARDLTNNNGKDFWKICEDFIVKEQN